MNKAVYEELIQDSPIAYCWVKAIKDKSGNYIDLKITDLNKAFERLMTNSKTWLLGKKLSEFINLEDINKTALNVSLQKCKKNGKYSNTGYNSYLKKHIDTNIHYIGDDEFIIRITEIDNKNTLFLDILRNSPFSVWIKDKDGRYLDVNIQFEKQIKKSHSEIIGKTDMDFWDKNIAMLYISQDDEVMQTKKAQSYQDVVNINDLDRTKVYDVTKWPYIDVQGNILGTVGISIELVNDAELRINLERNQRNFEAIVNYSDEVFVIFNRRKALFISPSFKKLFGEEPSVLYKNYKSWKDFYHPEDMKDIDIKFDEASEFIARGNPEKGYNKWFWIKTLPIRDERGNAIKKIAIVRDVTERRKLELELESLRMDFFANISHELRTPINVIYGALQLLKKVNEAKSYKELGNMDRYLNIIDQNCLRLLRLVSNLIDSTKIDAGYLEYKPKNFNIINFVEDICMSVFEFAKFSKLELIFDTDTEEEIIGFDLDMMERIILNLLSNAIKFNEENGSIYVNISCDEEFVNISIRDTGIGIDENNLKNIFGRFEQVSSKKAHYKEGSGIGLSLVKSLVDLHKGRIVAQSEIGKGSEFVVSIPKVRVPGCDLASDNNLNSIDKVSRMNIEFSDIYI